MTQPHRAYGDRYAVQERVGIGGMAEVYRARDELLGRDVAVKVLSERLSNDRSFVERFRREARAAANLNHPNIVSLYDYGADDGTYFIVMEYIDGRALADVIRAEGPLLPERAAEIAADVAKALERAHAAGLVHRDIKPSNIMLTSTGETKVTDFGIARAVGGDSEATVTQTGMVMGTAAYLAPEQAQGNPVDARTDIYSLGCVLYEMLTGQSPFAGENPLAIAYKHVREEVVPPSRRNPDVPPALDAIVLQAMAKDPANRYASAAEMRDDLMRFVSGQRVRAAPVPGDATTVAAPVAGRTEVLRRTETYEPAADRRKVGLYLLSALALLVLFALLAWLVFNNLVAGEQVRVPDLVGRDVDTARDMLEDRGLDAATERRPSRKPINQVIDQDPEPREMIEEGGTVTLIVSDGPRDVEVPDVVGLAFEDAEDELKDSGLKVGDVREESSDEFEENHVIEQFPGDGEVVPAGTEVDVVVSTGPEAVTVPSVVGQSEEDAIAEIQSAGLEAQVDRVPSDEEAGIVIDQDPDFGTEAQPGDTVLITISEGPETRPMPDVTGNPADAAEEELEEDYELNVTLLEETQPCTEPEGHVCRQEPPPGTEVEPGDSATLYVRGEGQGLFEGLQFAWGRLVLRWLA